MPDKRINENQTPISVIPYLVLWLFCIVLILFFVIIAQYYSVHLQENRNAIDNLSSYELEKIVKINKLANLSGTQEAQKIVDDYEMQEIEEVKQEKEKWIKRQEIRVENTKSAAEIETELKKKVKEAKEKKEDARKSVEKEAWDNTKKTWDGSEKWDGTPLTKSRGSIIGPSGKETYYNLDMSVCVQIMRGMGFSEEKYPYAVRSDGVKTLGGLVMVAASLDIRPKGSLIMTSCGPGIVVDTGGFAKRNKTQLDLAVNW